MRPQPPENHRPEDKDAAGHGPEIEGEHVMALPEPDLVDEALPIPLHQVIDRIELDQVRILSGKHLGRPEDRGDPEGELEHHGDQLPHVTEKDHQRGGEPGEAEQKDDGGEEVVEDLEVVEVRRISVEDGHDEYGDNEEAVDHEGREDLDDGEHADAEDHLLQEETVFDDGHGGAL